MALRTAGGISLEMDRKGGEFAAHSRAAAGTVALELLQSGRSFVVLGSSSFLSRLSNHHGQIAG
jgi:hypothetical protein